MNATQQTTSAAAPAAIHVRRILVPLDFSGDSEKALSYAAALARQFGAKISLLHVRPTLYYAGEMGVIPEVIPSSESVEKFRTHLDEIGRNRVPEGVVDHVLVRDGTPFDEICSAAREEQSDLIVIATHGYTGLKHVFLGSTAERVVRHAPCPVLIVRERERDFV
jgi:universal stress protein A